MTATTTAQQAHQLTRSSFWRRGFSLSYLDTHPGDSSRPAILLLHGFPDSAAMWANTIDLLCASGYRCIAPDTLGCGQSEIAPRVREYNVLEIVKDHIALLDKLGLEQVFVVGHDWGAVQAWLLAAHYPHRVRKLAVMSVGHPTSYARAGLGQKLAGWYIVYFCLAGLSERLLRGRGRFSLARVFGSHPDMVEVSARLSEPGRLTAALRIYRASLSTVLLKSHPKVSAPTLGIWSEGDVFCLEEQMRNSKAWVEGEWRYERRPCHHWISLAEPEWLGEQLLGHFS